MIKIDRTNIVIGVCIIGIVLVTLNAPNRYDRDRELCAAQGAIPVYVKNEPYCVDKKVINKLEY